MTRTIEFAIEQGDITDFDADVVALKYAQEFFGADWAVASKLGIGGQPVAFITPEIGDHRIVHAGGAIKATNVLFIGTPTLWELDYPQIRIFGAKALEVLAQKAADTKHLAMTVHGPGFGLDEIEAFLSQFEGCMDALRAGLFPAALERITVVELKEDRAHRLWKALSEHLAQAPFAKRMLRQLAYRLTIAQENQKSISSARSRAGAKSVKPHVFVAMPFKKEFEDVFYLGIQEPTRKAGFLCERVDQESFTGDILEQVKKRIEAATLVIAELTEANPNVYLEVGYAWGKGRPTVLLIKDEKELRFDVRGQRVLTYDSIMALRKSLAKELKGLQAGEIT